MEFLKQIIKNAISGIESLSSIVESKSFGLIVDKISYLRGKVIFCGVGKSGHIVGKISSTMKSFGIEAICLNPTDASHGDVGVIKSDDLLILVSKSGSSIELKNIINYAKLQNIKIVAITMNGDSALAKASDYLLLLNNVEDGFDPVVLAPMSSMSSILVLGDLIAAAVAVNNGINCDKYARFHPAGKIGLSMTKISDIMRVNDAIPLVESDANLQEIIVSISEKNVGITGVVSGKMLLGVITDGDLRRYINKNGLNEVKAIDMATKDFKYLITSIFADEAISMMTKNKITSSFVLNENKEIAGVVNMHDLMNL